VYVLCAQVFVAALGVGIAMPTIGSHAASFGAGVAGVGLAFGGFFAGRAIVTPVVGWLSDLRGRGTFLVAGFAGMIVAGAAMYVTDSVAVIVAARILHGACAAATLPILTASAGAICAPGESRSFLGTFNGLRSVGLAVGFAGGSMILLLGWDVTSTPHAVTAGAGVAGLALVLALPERATVSALRTAPAYRRLLRDPHVRGLAVYRLLLAMTPPALLAFVPVLFGNHAEDILGGGAATLSGTLSRLPPSRIAAIALIGSATGAAQIALGRILKNRGAYSPAAFAGGGALMVACTLVLVPHLRSFTHFAIAAFVGGIGVGALLLPGIVLMVEIARNRGLGSVIGLVELAAALGAAVGTGIATVATRILPSSLFSTAALFPLLAAAAFVAVSRGTSSETQVGEAAA
jgi:MFS family permease